MKLHGRSTGKKIPIRSVFLRIIRVMLRVMHQKLRLCISKGMLGTAFVLTNEKIITF